MRIGINILAIRKKLTGVGVYAFNLLTELLKRDRTNEYYIYLQEEAKEVFNFSGERIKTFSFKAPGQNLIKRLTFEHLVFPRLIRNDRLDLLHSLSNVSPYFYRGPSVVSVLDLRYRLPQLLEERFKKYYLSFVTPKTLNTAKKVITISEQSKKDIIKYYKLAPQKIIVTPLAAPGAFSPLLEGDVQQVMNKYQLKYKDYFLYLGRVEHLKNVRRLIEAFEEYAESNPEKSLVVAGSLGWQGQEIVEYLEQSPFKGRMKHINYIPFSDIVALYSGALAFVFPSLYEGFGLPLLEAAKACVPVISSNSSSLPEVLSKDAAYFVDPYSAEEISLAMTTVAQDKLLRQRLVKQALTEAEQFSWEKCADQTLQVYEGCF